MCQESVLAGMRMVPGSDGQGLWNLLWSFGLRFSKAIGPNMVEETSELDVPYP